MHSLSAARETINFGRTCQLRLFAYNNSRSRLVSLFRRWSKQYPYDLNSVIALNFFLVRHIMTPSILHHND